VISELFKVVGFLLFGEDVVGELYVMLVDFGDFFCFVG